MTCSECGDKPKKDNGFTKAVVEINNETLILFRKVVIPASMGDESEFPAEVGKFRNVLLVYSANGHAYLYSSDGIPTQVTTSTDELERLIDQLRSDLTDESNTRENADRILQQEITDLKNSPDVVDIVATYAALMAYDTSNLGDKDIIRVLTDETHDDKSTYYRWNLSSQTWTYIGAIEGYYTKAQIDTMLAGKQDVLTAGSNITISSNVISATDTTYTAGSGLNLNGTEFSVDTDTIATKNYVDTSPAFKPFPASVNTTGTTQQFLNSILALDAEVGTTYLGTVSLSDMPAGLLQEEVEVYVYSDYVVYVVMRSTDVSPYAWWCASYNYQGWRPVNTDTTYTAGTNIQISSGNVISATDTTYSDFTGTDGTAAGSAGLVPAPAITDAGKYLKADGTWATVSAGPTVVQTTGTSTTDVMSQNAATSMVYADPTTNFKIRLGANATCGTNAQKAVAIGFSATANGTNSIALGSHSQASTQGEMNIGLPHGGNNEGYNSSNYRLLTGLYEGQSAHDAATKGQLDNIVGKAKVLTADDCNYPTNNPTSVALWLLEPGVYVKGAGNFSTQPSANVTTGTQGDTFIIGRGTTFVHILHLGASEVFLYTTQFSNGSRVSNYDLHTWVYDHLSSTSGTAALSANQGRVLKDLIDSLAISGAGAPTTATVGTVGKLYEDTTNGKLYICAAVTPGTDPDPDTYTWEEVGGAGITPVQTTGTSTTDVMSQNAVTSMVFADPSTENKVQIGKFASSTGAGAIAISGSNGSSATTASGWQSTAIGYNSTATGNTSIALGPGAYAAQQGQMDIGTVHNWGYNSSTYRLLTGLYDPQSAHDAATKGYVDTAVASAGAPVYTNSAFNNLWENA